jgi:hypothetical protein
VPPRAPRASCTAPQIAAIYDACYGPLASDGACGTFTAADETCRSCVTTSVTDGLYGPVIVGPKGFDLNTPGCIALVEPCNQPCAQAIQAHFACRTASCDGCKPGEDDGGLCEHAASSCACQKYAVQAQHCADNILANAGPAGPCLEAPSFESAFKRIAAVFCGGQ